MVRVLSNRSTVTRVAIQNHPRSTEVVLGEFHDHKRVVRTIKIEADGSRTWCDALGPCQQFIERKRGGRSLGAAWGSAKPRAANATPQMPTGSPDLRIR